jgi:hypothetical protein
MQSIYCAASMIAAEQCEERARTRTRSTRLASHEHMASATE